MARQPLSTELELVLVVVFATDPDPPQTMVSSDVLLLAREDPFAGTLFDHDKYGPPDSTGRAAKATWLLVLWSAATSPLATQSFHPSPSTRQTLEVNNHARKKVWTLLSGYPYPVPCRQSNWGRCQDPPLGCRKATQPLRTWG